MLGKGPLPASVWKPLEENPLPYAGLATSLPTEYDYQATIEGRLPEGLRGTLFRNGVGLYDRGGQRKRMLLDGDGMVQSFAFEGGVVRYRNRFVRTEKFVRESEAGCYLFPTWSTLAPHWRSNVGGKVLNQAGTTVVPRGGVCYAFDEGQPPYELEAASLATRGVASPDALLPARGYNAHTKIDAATGEWHLLSIEYGKETRAMVVTLDRGGKITARLLVPFPRGVYVHDWFVSERHFAFILHPALVGVGSVARVMLGLDTYAEIIRWRPEQGNLVVVAPRDGTPPRHYEAPACFAWHTLNAFEEGGSLVADFVGIEGGGGLGTDHSPLFQLMRGERPELPAEPVAFVRRYVMELGGTALREERLAADRNYELPFVPRERTGRPYRHAFLTRGEPADMFWNSLVRLDARTARSDVFTFEKGCYCTEPVFAPRPGGGEDAGWVLSEGYDSRTRLSFLAVLDAEHLSDGPLAWVRLRHHVPMSFHGEWVQG